MGRVAPPLPPSVLPALAGRADFSAAPDRPIRRWSVLHACDSPSEVLPVAAAQLEAGMRPSLMTADGALNFISACDGARRNNDKRPHSTTSSLVHTWQDVRRWRNLVGAETLPPEILHAHCFSAAMAGTRTDSPLVYDFRAPMGAARAGDVPSTRPGPWLLRSLRVAEQFALTRAAAVVVHTQATWSQALERGVEAEHLFLIPDPVDIEARPAPHPVEVGDAALVLFAPAVSVPHVAFLLRAVNLLAVEVSHICLLLELEMAAAPPEMVRLLHRHAACLSARDGSLQVVSPADRASAFGAADLAVVNQSDEPDVANRAAIEALAHGCALLACDTPDNREVTPDGRGCLWFRSGDDRDLAERAAFLARNPEFRRALAFAGRTHIQATRARRVIAARYDDVYRHAWHARRSGSSPLRQLQTIRASS